VSFDEAMHTRGALVFGFSSDPLESTDRPARAYVGISLGNGKVLDISERSGQVKEMDPGGFYTYGAKIPEFHAPDDSVPPDDPFAPPQQWDTPDGSAPADPSAPTDPVVIPGVGPSQPPADATTTPATPAPEPAKSYGPDGHILHEDLPAPPDAVDPSTFSPNSGADDVCYPGDGLDDTDGPPDSPEDDVCYPNDDQVGPLSQTDSGYEQSGDVAYADDASSYDTGDTYASASDSYGSDGGDAYASDGGDSYGSQGDSYGSDSYASNDSYASDDGSLGSDDSSSSDMSTSDA